MAGGEKNFYRYLTGEGTPFLIVANLSHKWAKRNMSQCHNYRCAPIPPPQAGWLWNKVLKNAKSNVDFRSFLINGKNIFDIANDYENASNSENLDSFSDGGGDVVDVVEGGGYDTVIPSPSPSPAVNGISFFSSLFAKIKKEPFYLVFILFLIFLLIFILRKKK